MHVRTRMAPSPTGEYHIGSLRTMLYNFAFAKKNNGEFILRIEDTDQNRLVPGSLDRMLQVIKDYGLSWDEGPQVNGPFAPYIQSERLSLYKEHVQSLLASGQAYHCFCSKKRLDDLRDGQKKAGEPITRYDKHCASLSPAEVEEKLRANEAYVIRYRMPENTSVVLEDIFLGTVKFNTDSLDDYVLLKSDGYPTYHLAVVIDDHLMGITHVLRGVEWLASAAKHILLYDAFDWKMPIHGHLPNLKEVGANKKLSKRSGTVDANMFLKEGYLPEAVLNFLMFLGWNPGTEKEIYSLDEFISDFSLDRVHKTDMVSFDREKLLWYNGHYIRSYNSQELWEKITYWAQKYEVSLIAKETSYDLPYILKVTELVKERLKVLSEFNELTSYFFVDPIIEESLFFEYSRNPNPIISKFAHALEELAVDNWTLDNIETLAHSLQSALGLKPKEVFMTIRLALTGSKATPPLFDVIMLLGKEVTVRRLKKLV